MMVAKTFFNTAALQKVAENSGMKSI